MKLIYAGIEGTALPYSSLLFNCTRNQNCQRLFYVPVRAFSDIVFYADLPGKPDTILTEVIDVCDNDNTDTAVFTDYVVGQKPNGSWYGTFGNPVTAGVFTSCFFFKLTFTIGATNYIYYSEQLCYPVCEALTRLQGCYPNEPVGSNAEDCNGIYYGIPVNEDFLGTGNYRYFHWAFLRMASVIEQKNKLSFTLFNSRRAYKNVFTRESVLEFELVPTFFKDVLIGIFNRGNIKIDGIEWTLSEEQEFQIIDNDSKLWKLDVALAEQCKQYFGCGESDCTLPQLPCLLPDPLPDFSVEQVDGIWTGYLTGFPAGSFFVEWEVYDKFSGLLIDAGDSTSSPADDPLTMTMPDVNAATTCYLLRYRIRCGIDPDFVYSDWTDNIQFGNCSAPPVLYNYECERYLCSNCAEPLDTVIASSTNPTLTLFKYYKALSSEVVTLRPIATSVGVPGDQIRSGPYNTCTLCCLAPPPIELE